ncbi:jg13030, partial [Pararge aegeria aegeria]
EAPHAGSFRAELCSRVTVSFSGAARRRTGKIKGIERLLGAVDAPQESLIEVTSGQAKYEHQHRAIVWRMPRLPKEGQGDAAH